MSTKAPEKPETRTTRGGKPPIDPRIRARRIEVQRSEGRRRLQRLGLVGAAVAVVAGLWWLAFTPLFDVDAIRVRGAEHTGDAAVLSAIGIHRGDALFTADVGRASRSLARLPWVATVKVRRSWPGTVSVTLVERVPVAAVEAKGGGWVLVDRGGRQLATEKEPSVDLVRIAGRPIAPALGDVAGDPFRGAIDLGAAVPPSLRGALSSIWPKRDGSVDAIVVLPGGDAATARFGAPDQLEAKLVALASVLERADLDRVRIIDLRVPGAPALTRG